MNRKVVYFFCMDLNQDEVAPRVFEASRRLLDLEETEWKVDDYPVLRYNAGAGDIIYYVRTQKIICVEYDCYLPVINSFFSDCDLGVLVNWHGGQNAPDRVLCIHTVGDVSSVTFGPSEPSLSTNLARAMEKYRRDVGLEDFRVTTEATHWSGIVYGGKPQWINDAPLPFLDVEIGSTSDSFGHAGAAVVLAKALADIYKENAHYPTLLYCGGMHFEDTATAAVLHDTHPIALTHILPTRWLEAEYYTGDSGVLALKECIDSIRGGIRGFVVHEKLKREQKDLIDTLAEQLKLPVIRRKALKNPEQALAELAQES